jgi:peptidoglycan/LPS O-acetylase OafA/YrhL
VVVYHTSFYYEATFGPALVSQATMARFAMLGVSVFFAISGSLMAQILPRTNPCKFLTHRTVRIYPTFFLVVAALLPLGDAFHVMPPPAAILGLTLAPVGNAAVYYLHVEWTLVYECTYYIVLFAIALIGAWRYLSLIATSWIVAILVAPMAFIGWSDANGYSIHSILLSPASTAFAGGLLIPWVHRHVRLPAGVGVLATCVFLTTVGDINNAVYTRWLAGAVAVLLVLDAFRVQVPEVTATAPFLKLGDWSYGLYLAHAVVILLIVKLWPYGAALGMAGWAALGGALVFGCAFGVVDVRLYANLKTRADAAADRTRQLLVTTYIMIFIAAILASCWSVSDQSQIRWLQEVVRSNGWTRLLSHGTP